MIRLCGFRNQGWLHPTKGSQIRIQKEENPAAAPTLPGLRVNQNIDDTEDSSTARRAESFPNLRRTFTHRPLDFESVEMSPPGQGSPSMDLKKKQMPTVGDLSVTRKIQCKMVHRHQGTTPIPPPGNTVFTTGEESAFHLSMSLGACLCALLEGENGIRRIRNLRYCSCALRGRRQASLLNFTSLLTSLGLPVGPSWRGSGELAGSRAGNLFTRIPANFPWFYLIHSNKSWDVRYRRVNQGGSPQQKPDLWVHPADETYSNTWWLFSKA